MTVKRTDSGSLPILPGGIDLNHPEEIIPRRTGAKETYEELAEVAPARSTITSPVAFVRAFLELNPTMGRKEAIRILVYHGCNLNMARTQYQIFHAKRRAKNGPSRI